MKIKMVLFGILFLISYPLIAISEVVYSIDFTKMADGDAQTWFKENNYTFRLDADELNLKFQNGRLVLSNDGDVNGLLYKELEIRGAKRVRIEWGVNKYPPGIDWENGFFRDGVMLLMTFGNESISSGSFIIPNVPYFIALFLGEKEQDGKAYTGRFYKKGGRYICTPCGAPEGKTVVTDFEFDARFKELFNKSEVPHISAIGIEMDSRDIDSYAEAFINKIEFLAE